MHLLLELGVRRGERRYKCKRFTLAAGSCVSCAPFAPLFAPFESRGLVRIRERNCVLRFVLRVPSSQGIQRCCTSPAKLLALQPAVSLLLLF